MVLRRLNKLLLQQPRVVLQKLKILLLQLQHGVMLLLLTRVLLLLLTILLQHLGCSRELGLWLATTHTTATLKDRGLPLLKVPGNRDAVPSHVHNGLQIYRDLLEAVIHNYMCQNPQLSAMHLSVAGISLQWLSSMAPGKLAGLPETCLDACHVAKMACYYGQYLMREQKRHQLLELGRLPWLQTRLWHS